MILLNRNKRNVFILIAILILAIVAYVCVILYNKSVEAKADTDKISVLNLSSSDIDKVAYTNSEGTLSFTKSGESWTYDGDKDFPLNGTNIESIVSTAGALSAARLLEDNLDNISKYGLETPSYTLVLTDSKGVQTTLYIGDLNPVSGNYYAYTSLEDKVYMIDGTLISYLESGLYDMVTYDTIPTMSLTNMRTIEYLDADTNLNIEYFKDGNEQYDYIGGNYWFVKEADATYSVADTTEMSNIDSKISSLAFAGCVDYSATTDELSGYGLASPAATLKIHYVESDVEKDFTLYIGSVDSNGNYYVKTNLSDAVYLMAADTVTYFTGLNKTDLVNKTPFYVPVTTMDSMVISMADNTWDIVFTNTKDKDGNTQTTYSVNGKELSSKDFGGFYDSLKTMTAEMSNSENLSGTPYITITYNRNTDYLKTVTINLYTYNASFYAANVNGKNSLLINKTNIKELVDTLKSL